MNEEMLSRGKKFNNGEWVEGYVVQYPSGKTEIHKKCTEPPDVLLVCEIDPKTICRCTGRRDISGKLMYEGDIFESHVGTQILDITLVLKYGVYQAYCPVDREFMDNVGFYAESKGLPQMPIGVVEDYAKVIGNIFDNPELRRIGK